MSELSIPELREAAARKLGLREVGDFLFRDIETREGYAVGSCRGWQTWQPDQSHDQAALLLAEVERQNLQDEFMDLAFSLLDESRPCNWQLVTLSPEYKTRAAVAVLPDKEGT